MLSTCSILAKRIVASHRPIRKSLWYRVLCPYRALSFLPINTLQLFTTLVFKLADITLSDSATPYNKGYRRDIWSHGTNCTVFFSATPYSGDPHDFYFLHKPIVYGVKHLLYGVALSDCVDILSMCSILAKRIVAFLTTIRKS